MSASDFLRELQNSIPKLQKQIAADVVVTEAERQWESHFRREGFEDVSLQKWQPRKKADKNPAKRALLIQSGTLRRHATNGKVEGDRVKFVFPLEYERVHNEGLRAGRGAGFQMPERKYIGESAALEKRIKDKAEQLLNNHLKGL